MIDEKRLAEIDAATRAPIITAHPGDGVSSFEEMGELIRLARLGLWAEKHEIVVSGDCDQCGKDFDRLWPFQSGRICEGCFEK